MEALLLTALKDVTLNCFLLKLLSDCEQASLEIVDKRAGYTLPGSPSAVIM